MDCCIREELELLLNWFDYAWCLFLPIFVVLVSFFVCFCFIGMHFVVLMLVWCYCLVVSQDVCLSRAIFLEKRQEKRQLADVG